MKNRKFYLKRLLLGAATLAILFILACAALYLYFPPEKLKAAALEQISKTVNEDVSIEDISIGFYPDIEIIAKGIRISDRKSAERLASANNIHFDVDFLQLLHKNISLQNVLVTSPVIHLIHGQESGWNLRKLLDSLKNQGGGKTEKLTIAVNPVQVEHGIVTICDDRLPEPLIIRDINAIIDSQDRSLVLQSATLALPFLSAQFSGKISELDTPDPLLSLEANIHLTDRKLLTLVKSTAVPAQSSAVNFKLSISGRTRNPVLQGDFFINPQRVSDMKATGTVSGNINMATAQLELNKVSLLFGKSKLETAGTCSNVWSAKATGEFEGKGTFDSDDVVKIFGKSFVSELEPKGIVTAGFKAKGDKRQVNLLTDLNLENAEFKIPSIMKKEAGTPVNLKIDSQYILPNEFILNKFIYRTSEGKVEGKASISPSKEPWILADFKSARFPLRGLDVVPSLDFREGKVAFVAHVSQKKPGPGEPNFQTNAVIKNAIITTDFLSEPLSNINASVYAKNDKANIKGATFSLGNSIFDADAEVTNFSNPHIEGSIRAPELNLNEILAALTREKPDSQHIDENVTLRLLVEANSIYFGSTRTGAVSTVWTLENQVSCFEPLTLKTFDGTVRGNLKLDTSGDRIMWRTNFAGKHMKLEKMLAEFHPEKTRATGILEAEGQFSGSAGMGKEDFLSSIGGEVRVKVKDGDVEQYAMLRNIYLLMQLPLTTAFVPGVGEVAIANTLIDAARTRGRSLDPTDVAYEKMEGMFLLSQGVAHTEDFRFESGVTDLLFKGDINIPQNQMNMSVKATPLGSIGSLMGDIPIAGNGLKKVKEAILSTDFVVRGPISDPQVRLEAVEKIFGNGK